MVQYNSYLHCSQALYFPTSSMLSTTVILFLQTKFSLVVQGCPTTCGNTVRYKFADGKCECTGSQCENSLSGSSLVVSAGQAGICRNYCCANCKDGDRDYDKRILQQELIENTLSVSSEESKNTDPLCFCYGIEPIEDCRYADIATSFDECSDQCNSFCHVDFGVGTDGELEDCQASPLYIDEYETIDDNIAIKYISEFKASKVCVCELKGFKIGANNISDFEEQDCDNFCSGKGVRSWLTTDEEISPTSTSLPTWAVAFFSSVVCVGFLMITLLFCKTKPGSRSG